MGSWRQSEDRDEAIDEALELMRRIEAAASSHDDRSSWQRDGDR